MRQLRVGEIPGQLEETTNLGQSNTRRNRRGVQHRVQLQLRHRPPHINNNRRRTQRAPGPRRRNPGRQRSQSRTNT